MSMMRLTNFQWNLLFYISSMTVLYDRIHAGTELQILVVLKIVYKSTSDK